MCYSGCEYENRSGGCKKPYDKPCPMDIDEEKEEEIIIRPCDTCENLYVFPDGTKEKCLKIRYPEDNDYIKNRLDYYESECKFYLKIDEVKK